MALKNRALLAIKRIGIVIGIAIAFSVGLIGAIILSLYSSQTTVPNIVGKDRAAAEELISAAHLNFRVRATRPVSDAKPNTVLIQIPSAGQEVKLGQTVAVDISRPAKEGESSTAAPSNATTETPKKTGDANEPNSAPNSNESKPKRVKPANKNANDNSNGNTNRIISQNQNAKSNATSVENTNVNRTETPVHDPNSDKVNANRGNKNSNRRVPAPAPTP